MTKLNRRTSADENRVLNGAVLHIANIWRVTDNQLAALLGINPIMVSRVRTSDLPLDTSNEAIERGIHLVRLFDSLDLFMGSDVEASITWLGTPNMDLGGRPFDIMCSVPGMIAVADYLNRR